MSTAPFQRPVAPSERLYLAGLDVVPPVCLHVVVEGEGALEEAALRAAVEAAAATNPGCRLVLRGSGQRLRWVERPEPPPVRVVDQPLDPNDLDRSGWLREPIDPRFGSTCSVILLPGPCVVFRAFHGVMDGMGVFAWMRQVFRALRDEPVQAHTGRALDGDVASLDGPRPEREALSPNSPCALAPRGVDTKRFSWTRRRLDGVPRLRVPTLAMVLAALHRDMGEERPLKLMVPVDLRSRAPELRSTGNLSLPLFLDVPTDATLESVTAQMLAGLASGYERAVDPGEAWLARLPAGMVALVVRTTCWLASRKGGFPATAILSHLGRLQVEELSSPSFSAGTVWVLPVHAGPVPLSLTIVEHAEHVELTCCAPDHPLSRARAAGLLESVERAARDAAPPPPAREEPATAVVEGGASELEAEIKLLLAEVSLEDDLSEVEADMNLFELGIVDSFGFVKLIDILESKYQVGIQEDDYTTGAFFTLGGIAEWIGARRALGSAS